MVVLKLGRWVATPPITYQFRSSKFKNHKSRSLIFHPSRVSDPASMFKSGSKIYRCWSSFRFRWSSSICLLLSTGDFLPKQVGFCLSTVILILSIKFESFQPLNQLGGRRWRRKRMRWRVRSCCSTEWCVSDSFTWKIDSEAFVFKFYKG